MNTQHSKFVRLVTTVLVMTCVSVVVWADTVKLKNGSIIKGKVVSYSQGEFTVILDLGSSTRRSTSRMIIASEDIESIEFDSAESAPSTSPTEPVRQPDREPVLEPVRESPTSRTVTTPTPEVSAPPAATNAEAETTTGAEGAGNTSALPVLAEREVRVAAAADWSSTEIRVAKGQRIVIEATGEVDLGGSQRSGPNGIPRTDARKLMANRPTGALIAVIGDDNDNFIFVGRQTDFIAANNGILFLSINEGDLKDNTGSFIARVKVLGSK